MLSERAPQTHESSVVEKKSRAGVTHTQKVVVPNDLFCGLTVCARQENPETRGGLGNYVNINQHSFQLGCRYTRKTGPFGLF